MSLSEDNLLSKTSKCRVGSSFKIENLEMLIDIFFPSATDLSSRVLQELLFAGLLAPGETLSVVSTGDFQT